MSGRASAYSVARRSAYASAQSRGAATGQIRLSNASFNAGAAQGAAIGTFSVFGGVGTYTFSVTDTASNKVQVAGTNGVNLQAGSASASAGSFSITVRADNGAGSVFVAIFLVTAIGAVTNYTATYISQGIF
jgi:hypothetical protein